MDLVHEELRRIVEGGRNADPLAMRLRERIVLLEGKADGEAG